MEIPITVPSQNIQRAWWRDLSAIVEDAGHLKRRYDFYFIKTLCVVGLLSLCIIGMVKLSNNLGIDLMIALLLGFVMTQAGLLAHSAIHGQIFNAMEKNRIAGHVYGFLIGFSQSWWVWKHNHLHHGNPNNSEIDGDIRINWIVFTREQGMEKSGFDKFMVQHQQWFFIPLLFASAMSMWFASLSYLISPQEARKDSAIEIPLFLIHTICYVALLVLFLDSWWHIILFTLVHKMAQGLYMGSVFATNHKAMPVIDSKNSIGWEFILRQVLTSRNIQVPKFLRILFGGLDRQIEHHLFPWASEIELGSIQKEVKKFCRENNISYTETGFFGSMWDILRHLGGVASQLDKNSKATSRA